MPSTDRYPFLPGHQDTDTSIEAAASIVEAAKNLRGKVYRCIALSGDQGKTAEEVALELGLAGNHKTSPRISELKRIGWIFDSGNRRLHKSKRPAIVWVAL